MALSKKSGLFSSRNQGVPRWPTYTWLAKLLMRDCVTSVRMLLYAVVHLMQGHRRKYVAKI